MPATVCWLCVGAAAQAPAALCSLLCCLWNSLAAVSPGLLLLLLWSTLGACPGGWEDKQKAAGGEEMPWRCLALVALHGL